MTVIMFYEGVLQTRKDQPILDGFLLAHSLAAGFRLVIATSRTAERVEHQMRTERLFDQIASIFDQSIDLPPVPLWRRQIEKARSDHGVSMVVAADPEIVEWSVENGLIGLFFAHPGFNRPAQRPVQGSRSWTSLVQEMEARIS